MLLHRLLIMLRGAIVWRPDVRADSCPGSDRYLNAGVVLNWRVAPAWEFGIGGRYIDREVSDDGVFNKLQAVYVVLSVTHGFFQALSNRALPS
jgi:hypothetical protein